MEYFFNKLIMHLRHADSITGKKYLCADILKVEFSIFTV